MSLAVIGSGFGRTGTKSLKQALEMLGFGPCHHMQEVFDHPEQVAHWQDIAAGRAVPMGTLFAGYRAQVDWPGAHVWLELALAYPDAKVIHSVRPPEAWWQSFSGTIGPMMTAQLPAGLPPPMRAMLGAMREIVAAQTFGGRPDDKATAVAAFARRTEDVRAAIPARRLLVFDTAEGRCGHRDCLTASGEWAWLASVGGASRLGKNSLQRARGAAWRRPAWIFERRSGAATWAVITGAQKIRVGWPLQ